MTTKKKERRVGYWGRDEVPVAVSLAGVLHLEAVPSSFTALCNGKRFGYVTTPAHILEDEGMRIRALRICRRCEMRESKMRKDRDA